MGTTTIRDVAEHIGVSSATVSNVINGKGSVSEPTRRAVMRAVDELNYRANGSAQHPTWNIAQHSIGLLVKEIHNPYFADIFTGVQTAAAEAGYSVVVSSSEGVREAEEAITDLLVAKEVDGLIINPLLDAQSDLSHLFDLKRRNVPFVLLERVHGLPASRVDIDNVAASRAAVRHLIELGHRHIVHFAGPEYSMHTDERCEGFREAFFDSRLVFHEDLITPVGSRLENGFAKGMEYFRNWSPDDDAPTAVTCYNDLLAIGLLRALQELGLRVPEDISVVGFDDVSMCAYAPVPLTTVRVPSRDMGRQAVTVLARHMQDDAQHEPESVILQAELVVRASTGPPGGG